MFVVQTVAVPAIHRDEFRASRESVPGMTFRCDVGTLASDAYTVERLARLELRARRCGHVLMLRNASPELCDLLVFMGLGDVLRLEPRRQPEEREQRLGLEEERQLGDPPVV
jgi:hypothetical protein